MLLSFTENSQYRIISFQVALEHYRATNSQRENCSHANLGTDKRDGKNEADRLQVVAFSRDLDWDSDARWLLK